MLSDQSGNSLLLSSSQESQDSTGWVENSRILISSLNLRKQRVLWMVTHWAHMVIVAGLTNSHIELTCRALLRATWYLQEKCNLIKQDEAYYNLAIDAMYVERKEVSCRRHFSACLTYGKEFGTGRTAPAPTAAARWGADACAPPPSERIPTGGARTAGGGINITDSTSIFKLEEARPVVQTLIPKRGGFFSFPDLLWIFLFIDSWRIVIRPRRYPWAYIGASTIYSI